MAVSLRASSRAAAILMMDPTELHRASPQIQETRRVWQKSVSGKRKKEGMKTLKNMPELSELLNSGKPVAIDYYADWCGPCRMISPRFEALSNQYTNVTFVKVNVDEAPDIAQSMQITAMPTFHFFKGGAQVKAVVGADPNALEVAVKMIN